MNTKSAAYPSLKQIVHVYSTILPTWTFPFLTLTIASCSVFFSWFSGTYLFYDQPLLTRMIRQWMFTVIEYSVLVPGIGASIEVLGYSQNSLALLSNVFQLISYFILNRVTTKVPFTWRQYTAFGFIIAAIFLVI
uniref:Uncharacterized protein n=1 Tax=viral metagenome TaxID=1070528 RepID=A0A6C0HYR0_9ZZZZ